MNIYKKTLTIILVFFFLFSLSVTNALADPAPAGESFNIVILAVTILAVILSYMGIKALFKWFNNKNNNVPVSSILFDWEHVYLSIDKDKMDVEVTLEYKNTNPNWILLDLFFPFQQSVESSISNISVTSIHDTGDNESDIKNIDFTIDGSRILFDLFIGPDEKVNLRINYSEKLRDTKASYILTSIKKWQKPVSKAFFTVKLPSYIHSPRFTYEDNLESVNYNYEEKYVVYNFEMINLYPDNEFNIYWDKIPDVSTDHIGNIKSTAVLANL